VQPEQVEGQGPQRGQHGSAGAAITVFIFMELGIADPVPAFNAPAVPHQLQQGFWRGAQAGEKKVPLEGGLAMTLATDDKFNNPATAGPGLVDEVRSLFGPEYPGGVASMAAFRNHCCERDLAGVEELLADLAMQGPLVCFHCEEEVGPLLRELPKNGFWV